MRFQKSIFGKFVFDPFFVVSFSFEMFIKFKVEIKLYENELSIKESRRN